MKSSVKIEFLFALITSLLLLSASQELSRQKCDEYSMRNEVQPESNQYRKYMDKFIVAKTIFKEYDAVLISESYALTSASALEELQFTEIVVNNRSIDVTSQAQQDGIYLLKLRYNIELYSKMVCLWFREELPDGYDVFTVVHEMDSPKVPFLRTYFPSIDCPIVEPGSERNRDNFCLKYENGRENEMVFEHPTASSLIFFKSFQKTARFNKNHYVMGVLQKSDTVYGRKLWPNLRWIEQIVWPRNKDDLSTTSLRPETTSFIKPTFLGGNQCQIALFEINNEDKTRREDYLCEGLILNRDTVLVAANCVNNFTGTLNEPSQYIVKAGVFNQDGSESLIQTVSVVQINKHDLNNVTSVDIDIAIIKISKEFTIC